MQKNNWIHDYHILQNSPNESGAVCLGIILAYYGRFLSLSELSEKCGVTRNGTTKEKILNAATLEGLKGVWRSHDTDHQKGIDLRNNDNYPLITLNAKNKYSVIISVDDKFAKVYHSAKGGGNP